MTITLAQALPLMAQIKRKIADLNTELVRSRVVDVMRGTEPSPDELGRTVEEILSDRSKAIDDFLFLQTQIAKANMENHIFWNKDAPSIYEAIEMAKQIRQDVALYKEMGNMKKITAPQSARYTLTSSGTPMVQIALFTPELFRTEALALERKVNLLSSLIDQKNHEVSIAFDASEYLG